MGQHTWAAVVLNALSGYRESGFLCDFTLSSSDGSRLQVHKCILSAAVPSLYAELSTRDTRKAEKRFECSMHGLQALVNFLYTGVLNVSSCSQTETDYLTSLLHITLDKKEDVTDGEDTAATSQSAPSKQQNNSIKKIADEKRTSQRLSAKQKGKTETINSNVVETASKRTSTRKTKTAQCHGDESVTTHCDVIKLEPLEQTAKQTVIEQNADVKTDETGTIHCDVIEVEQGQRELLFPLSEPGPANDCAQDTGNHSDLQSDHVESNSFANNDSDIADSVADLVSNISAVTRVFLCNHCDKDFPCQEALSSHESRCGFKRKKKSRRKKSVLYKTSKKFICPKCDAVLTTAETLRNHIAYIHDKIKNFTCEVCGKKFARKPAFLTHKITHIDGKLFKCKFCQKEFKNQRYSVEHERECTSQPGKETKKKAPSPSHKCPFCPKVYKHAKHRNQHMKVCQNPDSKRHPCGTCGKALASSEALEDHIKFVHEGKKDYVCEICSWAYGTRSGLYEHQLMHTRGESFACKYCGTLFTQRGSCHHHEQRKTCLKSDKETTHCPTCQKEFESRRECIIHQKEQHPEVLDYLCNTCGKVFITKKGLTSHLKYVHREKQIACPKCPKMFKVPGRLNEHMDRVHAKKTRHICGYCGAGFYSKFHATVHELTHTQYKAFKCQTCGKAFISKSALRLHERWHSGRRPFKCRYCDRDFVIKPDREQHERCHTGERPYKCKLCEKAFRTCNQLVSHKRSHSGERPYHCTVCSATYVNPGKLKEHHKYKHGLNIPSRKYMAEGGSDKLAVNVFSVVNNKTGNFLEETNSDVDLPLKTVLFEPFD